MKNPKIYEVTISLPFALFITYPQRRPKRMDMGVPIKAAINKPGIPATPQSTARIKPICPAIAPRTIPKFNPIPASTGIRRDKTRKVLRLRRVIIS